MTRRLASVVTVLALVCTSTSLAVTPRASLPDIEDEVMCPVCGVPLNVAEAPQAERERELIRGLIARGQTKAQIKSALETEFGSGVLALPPADGFDVTAYLVPLALGLAALAAVGVALMRWRGPRDPGGPTGPPPLSGAQSRRLEEDLSRYDV